MKPILITNRGFYRRIFFFSTLIVCHINRSWLWTAEKKGGKMYKPQLMIVCVVTIGVPITNWLSDNKVKQLDYTNSIVSMANVYLNSD